MNDLKLKLERAAEHAAQTREWLQAAHSAACALPPSRGSIAELAIRQLLGHAVQVDREVASLLDAVRASL